MSLRHLEKAERFVPGQIFAHIISTALLNPPSHEGVRFILEDTPNFERIYLYASIDGSEVIEETLKKVYEHNSIRGKAQTVPPEEAGKMLYDSHVSLPQNLRPSWPKTLTSL